MTLRFTVDGAPRPKQSFKVGKAGGYTPARVKAWQNHVSARAREAIANNDPERRFPTANPVGVTMRFYLPDKRRRDLDNLSKAVADGMNGIVYFDDMQVAILHLAKSLDKDNPRVDVEVMELDK